LQTHIKNSPINGHWEKITEDEYKSIKDSIKTKIETRDEFTYYYKWNNIGRMRGNS
jgi:hypothetical protein